MTVKVVKLAFTDTVGRVDSWLVSHSALCHALGREFEPQWWQTLYWAQAHLQFFHDSIWFIWFDTIICLSNLSRELRNRKLTIFFKKTTYTVQSLLHYRYGIAKNGAFFIAPTPSLYTLLNRSTIKCKFKCNNASVKIRKSWSFTLKKR